VELAGRTPTLGSDEWCVTWKLYWPDGTPMRQPRRPVDPACVGRPEESRRAMAAMRDFVDVPWKARRAVLRAARAMIFDP